MENRLDERISYWENPAYGISRVVAEVIRNEGYNIANCSGFRIENPSYDVIGVLEPRESIERKFWKIKCMEEQRGLFIGRVWMDNDVRKARPDDNFVLEVYGRENVPKMSKLAENLVKKIEGVKIKIVLEDENVRYEEYESDGSWGMI